MDDAIILLTNSMKEDPYLSQTVTLQPDDNDVKVATPRSTMIPLSSDTSPLSFKCVAATNRLTIMPTRSNRARQNIIDYLKRKIVGFFAVEAYKLEGQLEDAESKKMCDLLYYTVPWSWRWVAYGGLDEQLTTVIDVIFKEELDETNTAARVDEHFNCDAELRIVIVITLLYGLHESNRATSDRSCKLDVFRGDATGYDLCAAASGSCWKLEMADLEQVILAEVGDEFVLLFGMQMVK
ncbi:hypothetical protein LTR17_002237 [Elasticomyces elasticus]|nr:hypothetical protein LTR17_002237 [Elasticomyces elasticus]